MAGADTTPTAPRGHDVALLRDRRIMGLLITIGVMALLLLTVVGFSGAYFTSSSRSPDNEFVAGSAGLELSRTGQLVDGTALKPGVTRTGEQTVTNTGSRGSLWLDLLELDPGSELAQVLQVVVRQTDPPTATPAYDGPLVDLDRVPLATLGEDEARTYQVSVTWPASETSPSLAGARTSLRFDWQLETVP